MVDMYTSYFISPSSERQAELDYCLQHNLRNHCIRSLTVFTDGPAASNVFQLAADVGMEQNKLHVVLLDRVPTYRDWLRSARLRSGVSVFANADIYFDASLCRIGTYLQQPQSLVCLSRHEVAADGAVTPHPHPKWSQDVWAIRNDAVDSISFLEQLDIRIGLCRCDNHFASYFAMRGWDLFNPMADILCYHKHASGVRTYEKKDPTIVGTLAFVYPCEGVHPSKIAFEIMPLKNENIMSCRVNPLFQK